MYNTPELPFNVDPEPKNNPPLAPELAVPVLNTSIPLIPVIPELAVWSNKAPLVPHDPYPLDTNNLPPFPYGDCVAVDVPADKTNSPPAPLLPVPTATYTEPALPDVAEPEPKYNAPVLPLSVVPDPTYKAPLLPELAVPVLNTNKPLTPAVPAFAVLNNIEPLVEAAVYPVISTKRPPMPVAYVDNPAFSTKSPPVPLLPEPTITYTAPARPDVAAPDPMKTPPVLPFNVIPVPI